MWPYSGFQDGETTGLSGWVLNFFSEWEAGGDFIEKMTGQFQQRKIENAML